MTICCFYDIFTHVKISVLIPCHNEEKAIRACIESCLGQSRPLDEIVVVNDGSTDGTASILETFGDKIKVVTLETASGNKSYAQEYGLKHITGDVFIATDGDTVLDTHFTRRIEMHFKNPEIEAVCGYIKSIKYNWITACRELSYILTQDLHKVAQAYLNAITVIPGCAGAFRTETYKRCLNFEHDTITEDLDFTFKLHEQAKNIFYDRKAIIYTQDPGTLTSYVKQMQRWYGGNWQNLFKHYKIFLKPGNALELSLNYVEGLLIAVLLFVLPFFFPVVIVYTTGINLAAFLLLGVYGSISRKRIDLLIYAPLGVFFAYVDSLIFTEQFFRQCFFRQKKQIWYTPDRRENNLSAILK